MSQLTIIGGGLAGCEAAWQAARRGVEVNLYEMRPGVSTGAHTSGDLAELVCSNSLGSRLLDRASGLLQAELERLGSLLLECARSTSVPAGSALAVDRVEFSRLVTKRLEKHPKITVVREELKKIPAGPCIIATGPLTSPSLSAALQDFTGTENLFFYDAISPVIHTESIDMNVAFRASRFGRGEDDLGDYINCPLSEEKYRMLVALLVDGKLIELRDFEKSIKLGVNAGFGTFFEGCLPIEELAKRGMDSLAFGPLRPIGLVDPRTGERFTAVVQLRQENRDGSRYNMVGFQTNLLESEQVRIFRTIPGLENAEFARFGQMHRNTYLLAPIFLKPSLQSNSRDDLFFAGQIAGIEGYMGNIATGLMAGWNAARFLRGDLSVPIPNTTMIGSLCHTITHSDPSHFQPVKANFGILPPMPWKSKNKRERYIKLSERALNNLMVFLEMQNESTSSPTD